MRHCLRRASSILWHGHHLRCAGMKIRSRIERANTSISLRPSRSLTTGLTSAPSLDVRSQTKLSACTRVTLFHRARAIIRGFLFARTGKWDRLIKKEGGRRLRGAPTAFLRHSHLGMWPRVPPSGPERGRHCCLPPARCCLLLLCAPLLLLFRLIGPLMGPRPCVAPLVLQHYHQHTSV